MVVIKMVVEPNVGLEITKGVGKVVEQELHEILELVCSWAVIMLPTIYVVGGWEVTVVIEMVVGE